VSAAKHERDMVGFILFFKKKLVSAAKHERDMVGREHIEVAEHLKCKPRNN